MRLRASMVKGEKVVLGYGGQVVVEQSNFDIPAGAITAVIGPNGSGKSTLLSAIAGLHTLVAGTIDFTGPSNNPVALAYVLQTTKVNESLPVTVQEVVTMGRYSGKHRYRRLGDEDRRSVAEAMERTGIIPIADRHIHRLSGGQRQRVFVAQGLAQDHNLLLLDEPLTGIDLTTAQAIDQVIHDEIDEGCTVVLTTHDLSEAQIADHVILLSGRVVAEGPPDEVLTTANLAAAYGPALLHLGDRAVMVDDPAHTPIPGRHSHRPLGHPESDPSSHQP